jgi:outer membrane protein assembly factor BamD (BamD/ComL family)
MRPLVKIVILLCGGVLIVSIVWIRISPNEKAPAIIVAPEIRRVGTNEAVIAWQSTVPSKGKVHYRPAGIDTEPMVAIEDLDRSYRHEVTLTGLQPGHRYTYWINSPNHRFQFQTQPSANAPFSFLVVNSQYVDDITILVQDEIPDFIFVLGPDSGRSVDPFADVRAFQPIFKATGPDIDTSQAALPFIHKASWQLNWGGLTLDVVPVSSPLRKTSEPSRAHTRGMLLAEPLPALSDGNGIPSAEIFRKTDIHRHLNAMAETSARPAFVLFPAPDARHAEIDETVYCSLPMGEKSGVVRVDIDVGSATAVFLEEGRRVALKKPPIKSRMTCAECRRLADRGTYEAAIEAYEAFIRNNAGHFQVDDACYAVAEILDEKLFRYDAALQWYRRLVRDYPQGTLTPLARQRIAYITKYGESDFKVLAAFERIRKLDFARYKDDPVRRQKLLASVKSLIADFPDARLAPTMQYWLASQYRLDAPSRAISAFRFLKTRYPTAPEARNAGLHVADTLYAARSYSQARDAYEHALAELPDLQETINAQINRCNRNLRRFWFAIVCGALLVSTLALGLLLPPMGMDLMQAAKAGGVFGLLSVVIFGGAWLIREQFLSTGEMMSLTLAFSGAAAAAGLIASLMREKNTFGFFGTDPPSRSITGRLIGALSGTVLFVAGMYLAIYLINEHYLITVHL